jgi:hypothetical protein
MSAIPFWDPYSSPSVDGPDSDPNPWGQVTIGGILLPGYCEVSGAAIHRIDVQKANGVDGGTLIERGYQPGEFDIDMKIWTEKHWDLWRETRPFIFRRLNKVDLNDAKKSGATREQVAATEKASLSISHPALADAEITACLIKSISLPRPGPERGTKIITLKCVQYITPAVKVSAIRKHVGVKGPTRDPRVDLNGAVNKPTSPLDAGDGGPNGAPVTTHGGY